MLGTLMAVSLCLPLCGCGKKQKLPDGIPDLQPTTITITQDNKPLEGASIAFLPIEASNSWNAGGITDATGKAIIKTLSKYDGVAAGEYRILITKREAEANTTVVPDQNTDPEGYSKYMRESSQKKTVDYDLIDPKFSKISSNTETINVTTGTNEKTIDVGKAVRVKR